MVKLVYKRLNRLAKFPLALTTCYANVIFGYEEHSRFHIWFLTCHLLPGLPLVVAFLPDQRLHSSVSVYLCCALLLLKAANNWSCQHHPLLWIHSDYGPDLLPFHRWVFPVFRTWGSFKLLQWFLAAFGTRQLKLDIILWYVAFFVEVSLHANCLSILNSFSAVDFISIPVKKLQQLVSYTEKGVQYVDTAVFALLIVQNNTHHPFKYIHVQLNVKPGSSSMWCAKFIVCHLVKAKPWPFYFNRRKKELHQVYINWI